MGVGAVVPDEPPIKIGACVTHKKKPFDYTIWLVAQRKQEAIIRDVLTLGAQDIGEYGWLCRSMLAEFDESYVQEMARDSWYGPWPRSFREEIIAETKPYIRISVGTEQEIDDGLPWAFIWFPSFPEDPGIIARALNAIAFPLNHRPSLIDDIINGVIPLPERAELSSSRHHLRTPVPRGTANEPNPPAKSASTVTEEPRPKSDALGRPPEIDWHWIWKKHDSFCDPNDRKIAGSCANQILILLEEENKTLPREKKRVLPSFSYLEKELQERHRRRRTGQVT